MKTYDLKSEIQDATMGKGYLKTPAGFKLTSHPKNYGVEVITTPEKVKLEINTDMIFSSDDSVDDGEMDIEALIAMQMQQDCTWNIYMPKSLAGLKVKSKDAKYTLDKFVRDLFKKYAKLMDEQNPDDKPIKVKFHKA